MSNGLPNLLIAGVPKAGTTSLFSYLGQHADICPADEKEIRYFKPLLNHDGVLPSLDSYRKHFSHCGSERYLLEATPSYSYGGERLRKAIKGTLIRPRIIISLRDPAARLWSAYTFQQSRGNLPGIESFDHYISECENQRAGGKDIIVGGHFNGVSIGFYGKYLEGWFETFGMDTKIVFAEYLSADPRGVVTDLCRWLSIDDESAASFNYELRNKTAPTRSPAASRAARSVKRKTEALLTRSSAARSALRSTYLRLNTGAFSEKFEPETRQRLERLYATSNHSVAETLRTRGYVDLPHWLRDT